MISTTRQYHNTKKWLEAFESGADGVSDGGEDLDPIIQQAMHAQSAEQARERREELREYERLKAGLVVQMPLNSLLDVPRVLIAARVAAGMTQQDLANALGVSQQQVQRDEHRLYDGAGYDRMCETAEVLGLRISGLVQLPQQLQDKVRGA